MNINHKRTLGIIVLLAVFSLGGFLIEKTNLKEKIISGAPSSLAAIPASWSTERIRQEINRRENVVKNMWDRGNSQRILDGKVGEFNTHMKALNELRKRDAELYFESLFGENWRNEMTNPYEKFNLDEAIKKSAKEYGHLPLNDASGNPLGNISGLNSGGSQAEVPWAEQIHHTGEPWGGLVTFRYPCDCEKSKKNYFVILNDYVRNKSIFLKYEDKKSHAYMYWELKVGGYGLGTMDVGGTCYTTFYDPKCERPLNVDGIINSGPGFGSSGQTGLSFPSILGPGSPLDLMNGGTVPGTFTF